VKRERKTKGKQMKVKLTLKGDREVELEAERIACNNIILPWESNYHGVKLYVIGNEYGALGAVWAEHEQDAFDELVDQGMGDGLLIEDDEANEEIARLGNAGESADLTHAWIQSVRLDEKLDCRLLCAFAEARGNNSKNLDR